MNVVPVNLNGGSSSLIRAQQNKCAVALAVIALISAAAAGWMFSIGDQGFISALYLTAQAVSIVIGVGTWKWCKHQSPIKIVDTAETTTSPIQVEQPPSSRKKATDQDFQAAIAYITDCKLGEADHPKDGAKSKNIYMPKDLPVVIRSHSDKKLFGKKQQAYTFCQKRQYKHVVAPKAILHNDYIIEERLPSENISDYYIKSIAFYYQHKADYTAAIGEFIDFLNHFELTDLLGGDHTLLNYVCFAQPNTSFVRKTVAPRFDNLLLYEDECDGKRVCKIGIIDLDTLCQRTTLPTLDEIESILRIAIILFPYHTEEIIEIGKNQFHISDAIEQALRDYDAVIANQQIYKILTEDHMRFLQDNGITRHHQAIKPITTEHVAEIKKNIDDFLTRLPHSKLRLHQHIFKDPLEDPLAGIRDHLDQVITNVTTRLGDLAETTKPCYSNAELIAKRTFLLNIHTWSRAFCDQHNFHGKKCIVYALVFDEIFANLYALGDIAYFQHDVTGGESLLLF